jgi:hypothetical protein
MIVEIGAEAAQFPEKKYINGIVFAVYISILEIFEILRMCPYLLAILPRFLPQENSCRASYLRGYVQGNVIAANGYVHW